MNNKVTNHPKHYFLNRMTRTSTARTALGEFSMYTPKHIAEAMAELFDDPKWEGGMGATTIAWCNLWDRVASETGLSEEALMQLMKEGFLLRMEQKRQMGKVMRLLTAKPGDRSGIRRAGRQGGIQ
jgi:hypothetical protein